MDACACVSSVASAAHECSANSLNGIISGSIVTTNSADCFASALLILCAVADFNIRASSLLRAALTAAISCCCPRGRILLASAAFPCDIWGKEERAPDSNDHASSGEEEQEIGNMLEGGMSDVARAIKGQGGVLEVGELLADGCEGTGSRAALAHVIGGGFLNQLMQVAELCSSVSYCSRPF
jgi:hypothetical protein